MFRIVERHGSAVRSKADGVEEYLASCLRFRNLGELALDVLGEVIASTSVDDFIAAYERSRGRP